VDQKDAKEKAPPRARGRPSASDGVAAAEPIAPPVGLNAAVFALHKSNVEKTLAHPVFENLKEMEPISITNNTDEVRTFGIWF
jgi:hypothetical protein